MQEKRCMSVSKISAAINTFGAEMSSQTVRRPVEDIVFKKGIALRNPFISQKTKKEDFSGREEKQREP